MYRHKSIPIAKIHSVRDENSSPHAACVFGRHAMISIVLVFISISYSSKIGFGSNADDDQKPTPSASDPKLQERDRLQRESIELEAKSRLDDAIEATKKASATNQSVLGIDHPESVSSLQRLADLYLKKDDLSSARNIHQQVLEIQSRKFGAKDWRVIDEKLAVDYIDRLKQMKPDERVKLLGSADDYNKSISLDLKGDSREAIDRMKKSLEIRQTLLGKDHIETAKCLHQLAYMLNKQEDFIHSKPLITQELKIRQTMLGNDHPDTASSLNNLGYLLQSQRDYKEAKTIFERALKIHETTRGTDHPDTATSLNYLGNFWMYALENYDKAKPLFERALKIRENTLGLDHPDTAKSVTNLAWLLQAQGDYAGAKPLFSRSLKFFESTSGTDHPYTASALASLGSVLQAQGDFAAAKQQFERALKTYEREFGQDSSENIGLLQSLVYVHKMTDDLITAQSVLKKLLEIEIKKSGKDSWMVTDIRIELEYLDRVQRLNHEQRKQLMISDQMMNLIDKLHKKGEYYEALDLAMKSLAIRLNILGSKDLETGRSLFAVASVLRSLNNFNASKTYFESALKIFITRFGPENPETLSTMDNLGSISQSLSDFDEAQKIYERTITICEKILGPENLDLASRLDNLGSVLKDRQKYGEAKIYYDRAWKIREKLLGKDHPAIVTSQKNIALLHMAQNDYTGSKKILEEAIDLTEWNLGPNHISIAEMLIDLSEVSYVLGDFYGSIQQIKRSLKIREEAYGPNHPDTAYTLSRLGQMLIAQNDEQTGSLLLKRANNIMFNNTKAKLERLSKLDKQLLKLCSIEISNELDMLALELESRDDLNSSKELLELALKFREQSLGPDHIAIAKSYEKLSSWYNSKGDSEKSLEYAYKALILREKIYPNNPETALVMILYSRRIYQSNMKLASELFEKGLQIIENDDVSFLVALSQVAKILLNNGENDRLLKLLDKHEKNLNRRLSKYVVDIYSWDLALSYWSIGSIEKSLTLMESHVISRFFRMKPNLSYQSERVQMMAISACRSALDHLLSLQQYNNNPNNSCYRYVYQIKGSVALYQRRIHEFRAMARRSHDPKVESLFQDLNETTRNLANIALDLPKPEQRVTWEGQIAELTQNKEEIEKELSHQSDEFRKLEKRDEITAEQIRSVLPADTALVDLLEYTHSVPSKEHKGRFDHSKHFLAFVIRPNQPTAMIDLGASEPIDKAVNAWRARIPGWRNPIDGADDPALVLREKVWLPLAKHLEGARTILLSPDGSLNQIPFDALPGVDPKKFMIEERSIVLIPSPQMLPELLVNPSATAPDGKNDGFKPSLLLVGNVDFGSSPGLPTSDNLNRHSAARSADPSAKLNFPDLPKTKDEIDHIETFYRNRFGKNASSLMLDREKATEDAFRKHASEYRWIHLATHGFFAPANIKSALASQPSRNLVSSMIQNLDPKSIDRFGGIGVVGFHPGLLSGVVLAGANRTPEYGKDDGILTATEVAGLDLSNVDLAVLSGCETGLGQTAGGEGLLGLQRAFQVAGARSVVAGLWKVDDKATQMLISRFYENLWGSDRVKKPMSKIVALREAKLWMMKGAPSDGTKSTKQGLLASRGEKPDQENRNRGLKLIDNDLPERYSPYYWAAFVLSGDWR
jgi:CHAT domain-containing protein/Tfp pilus assembly protein PilF